MIRQRTASVRKVSLQLGVCWWVSCLFLQVGISSEMIKDLMSTRPAHLFPNLCLRRVFLLFSLAWINVSERGNVLKGGENTPVFFKRVAGAGLTIRAAKLAYCLHQAINGVEQGRCEESERVGNRHAKHEWPAKTPPFFTKMECPSSVNRQGEAQLRPGLNSAGFWEWNDYVNLWNWKLASSFTEQSVICRECVCITSGAKWPVSTNTSV